MTMRDEVALANAVVSISVALTVMKRFERGFYARIGTKREIARGLDRREVATISSMAAILAHRFAPFALYVGDVAHHWEVVRPTVERALAAVPMDLRIAFAQKGQTVSRDIAQRVFAAVDREFRLVPLVGRPSLHGKDPWDEIFQREHGSSRSLSV